MCSHILEKAREISGVFFSHSSTNPIHKGSNNLHLTSQQGYISTYEFQEDTEIRPRKRLQGSTLKYQGL